MTTRKTCIKYNFVAPLIILQKLWNGVITLDILIARFTFEYFNIWCSQKVHTYLTNLELKAADLLKYV